MTAMSHPLLRAAAAAATSGSAVVDTATPMTSLPTAAPAPVAVDPALVPVPGPDQAPEGPYRTIGGWLTATTDATAPVTATSPWFTVTHWHWLAAKGMVRPVPYELGALLPQIIDNEAQIIHDLTAWEALDSRGRITAEAEEMFGAVSGAAALTLYGTVLLYAHRRAPVELPGELKEFGLAAAVRDVPRVTFAIGVTDREVVTALINQSTVVIERRRRDGDADDDAAAALRRLLDPGGDWKPYPLPVTTITLPGDAVDQLATSEHTAGVIDAEPGDDATDEERAADAERRRRVGDGARRILTAAQIPGSAAGVIADIAAATTDALAQVTVRDSSVDVARGEPSALALAFLRGKGVVASYPVGSGRWRRVVYTSGNKEGIATGIGELRRVVSGL